MHPVDESIVLWLCKKSSAGHWLDGRTDSDEQLVGKAAIERECDIHVLPEGGWLSLRIDCSQKLAAQKTPDNTNEPSEVRMGRQTGRICWMKIEFLKGTAIRIKF
jgi:hypothetical protein